MLIVQRFYETTGARTYATTKIAGKDRGLKVGEKVNIYQKDDCLFYSHDKELPESAGFKFLVTRKVVFTQNRPQVFMPTIWFNRYCAGLTHVKVYYTNLGLFIKPYFGGE